MNSFVGLFTQTVALIHIKSIENNLNELNLMETTTTPTLRC